MAKVIKRHWLALAMSLLVAAALAVAAVLAIVTSSPTAKAAGAPATAPAVASTVGVLDPTHNAQIKSVVDAAKSGKNPERLSPLFAPHKFDAAAYAKNPQSYLDIVEPGRIWDVAPGGPSVKEIAAKGSPFQEMQPLGTASFTVIAAANAPVTFTSFDGGCFQNELSSITLQADASGQATVQFTATAGTVGNVNMLAASPLCSGQLTIIAHVAMPKQ